MNDEPSNNFYSHSEASDGLVVSGSYRVLLPDSRTQIVDYTADSSSGYVASVKYEDGAKNSEFSSTIHSLPPYQTAGNVAPVSQVPVIEVPVVYQEPPNNLPSDQTADNENSFNDVLVNQTSAKDQVPVQQQAYGSEVPVYQPYVNQRPASEELGHPVTNHNEDSSFGGPADKLTENETLLNGEVSYQPLDELNAYSVIPGPVDQASGNENLPSGEFPHEALEEVNEYSVTDTPVYRPIGNENSVNEFPIGENEPGFTTVPTYEAPIYIPTPGYEEEVIDEEKAVEEQVTLAQLNEDLADTTVAYEAPIYVPTEAYEAVFESPTSEVSVGDVQFNPTTAYESLSYEAPAYEAPFYEAPAHGAPYYEASA